MKECGPCSLCCKLLNVPGLARAGEMCRYCKPGTQEGCCTIHDDRPEVCLGYNCFWRAESWPDELRPDRVGVIFEALPGVKTVLVSVEPSTPDAWKEKEVLRVIGILRKKRRPVVLKTQNDSTMFIPDGMGREDVLRDIRQVLNWQETQKWRSQHIQPT